MTPIAFSTTPANAGGRHGLQTNNPPSDREREDEAEARSQAWPPLPDRARPGTTNGRSAARGSLGQRIRRVCGVVGSRGGIDLPLAWDSLEVARPAFLEPQAGPGRQVANGARYQDLAGTGGTHDSRSDVNGDAAHLGPALLHLTGMQAGAHLNAQLPDFGDNIERAADRCGRCIEDGEEAVACRVNFAAVVPPQGGTDHRVVELNELSPGSIAKFGREFRRADNVGEQDCGQESLGTSSAWHGPSLTFPTRQGNTCWVRCCRVGERAQRSIGRKPISVRNGDGRAGSNARIRWRVARVRAT